jgi:holliday junction DNA helicase RuvA
MIVFLKGKILHVGSDSLELLSGDVGYKIHCPAKAGLFVHMHVREDAQTLYGFDTRGERDFFEVLIGISGIGPKGAIGVLSSAPLDLLKKGIASGDISVLTRVSGIGQKTAQRIILELREKLGDGELDAGGDIREGSDVVEALVGLGYSRPQAQTALRSIPASIEGVEIKVKEALKILAKG